MGRGRGRSARGARRRAKERGGGGGGVAWGRVSAGRPQRLPTQTAPLTSTSRMTTPSPSPLAGVRPSTWAETSHEPLTPASAPPLRMTCSYDARAQRGVSLPAGISGGREGGGGKDRPHLADKVAQLSLGHDVEQLVLERGDDPQDVWLVLGVRDGRRRWERVADEVRERGFNGRLEGGGGVGRRGGGDRSVVDEDWEGRGVGEASRQSRASEESKRGRETGEGTHCPA